MTTVEALGFVFELKAETLGIKIARSTLGYALTDYLQKSKYSPAERLALGNVASVARDALASTVSLKQKEMVTPKEGGEPVEQLVDKTELLKQWLEFPEIFLLICAEDWAKPNATIWDLHKAHTALNPDWYPDREDETELTEPDAVDQLETALDKGGGGIPEPNSIMKAAQKRLEKSESVAEKKDG